jgi:hypothetical protein
MDIGQRTPRTYQWNLTYEREIFKDTKLEFAYVGNKGTNLPYQINLTQIPPQFRKANLIGGWNGVSAPDLAALYKPFGATFADQANITIWGRGADSQYHAFQLYMVKRFTNNFTYNIAYTFSKVIGTSNLGYGDTPVTDNSNIGYDRGLPAFDRTHIFVVNGIYNLPKFQNLHKFVRGAIGDWELTTIYSYNTGVPLTIASGFGTSGTRNDRANQVGDPAGPHSIDKWFNTGAFSIPTVIGAFGNSAHGISGERAPSINNVDFSIYKNFGIPWMKTKLTAESAKIQFRAELFNALNHAQFFPPNTSISPVNVITDQTNPNKDVDTTKGTINIPVSKYSNTFGTINRARDPREIQFALKIIW